MDKVHLNNQQMKQLVDFIKAKRFFDPPVVVEILDHLACKTEEIVALHPEIEFSEAIQKAYKSFGVMGFRPIEDAYERTMRKKYRKIYWKKVKAIVTDIRLMPLILFAGWLAYKVWMWSAVRNINGFLGENLFFDFFFGSCITASIVSYQVFHKEEFFKSKLSASIPGMAWYVWWLWVAGPHEQAHEGVRVYIGAAVCTTFAVLSLISFIADWHRRTLAFREYMENREYVDGFKWTASE
ncbi:hypothetical protein ACTHGU_02620 [Chitinophagaceae bacterium MMS25-I14]